MRRDVHAFCGVTKHHATWYLHPKPTGLFEPARNGVYEGVYVAHLKRWRHAGFSVHTLFFEEFFSEEQQADHLRDVLRYIGLDPTKQDAHATSKRKYNTKGSDFDYFPRHAFSSFGRSGSPCSSGSTTTAWRPSWGGRYARCGRAGRTHATRATMRVHGRGGLAGNRLSDSPACARRQVEVGFSSASWHTFAHQVVAVLPCQGKPIEWPSPCIVFFSGSNWMRPPPSAVGTSIARALVVGRAASMWYGRGAVAADKSSCRPSLHEDVLLPPGSREDAAGHRRRDLCGGAIRRSQRRCLGALLGGRRGLIAAADQLAHCASDDDAVASCWC